MLDLEKTTIADQLKRIAAYRGYNVKTLGEEFNRRYGTKYVQQSFSKKINAGVSLYQAYQAFRGDKGLPEGSPKCSCGESGLWA